MSKEMKAESEKTQIVGNGLGLGIIQKANIKMVSWFDDHFYRIEYSLPLPENAVEGTEPDIIVDYFPSVTTKLESIPKPELNRWRGDVGNREADMRMHEGADRGSRLHHAWQTYTNGGAVIWVDYKLPQYSQQEILDISAKFENNICILNNQNEMYEMTKLQKFIQILKPKQTLSEHIVYDIETRDAGTADNFFYVDKGDYPINGAKTVPLEEGWYCFDLKTGNGIGTGETQVSVYAILAEKMKLCPEIKGALIGHTGSKNKQGIEGFGVTVLDRARIEDEYKDFITIYSPMWLKKHANLKPKIFDLPALIFQPKEEQINDSTKS